MLKLIMQQRTRLHQYIAPGRTGLLSPRGFTPYTPGGGGETVVVRVKRFFIRIILY